MKQYWEFTAILAVTTILLSLPAYLSKYGLWWLLLYFIIIPGIRSALLKEPGKG